MESYIKKSCLECDKKTIEKTMTKYYGGLICPKCYRTICRKYKEAKSNRHDKKVGEQVGEHK
jgi:hypothetical protein